jgi:TonB family protein
MGIFHREIITFGLGLCVLLSVPHKVCTAQGVTNSESPQTKLVQPIYPPVARATRTTGDVDLRVTIRQDGAVDSVVVLSGHPLLKESAVTSAQQSQFECRGCTTY